MFRIHFPHRLLEFRYDYMGRRVQKRVVDVTLSQEISCRRFLYDGWNLIAEYAAPGAAVCGALLRSYTWGLDIAVSMSNAGGVGALLQIADHPTGKTYLPTYDGNGNIAALINASSGALAAAYEYSPYGESLRSQILDSTVADNPFRFSTKWTDLETGLVYYGRRYYTPSQGRFLGRDPIEEAGGLNLYGFCGNNGINRWDVLGCEWSVVDNDDGTFSAKAWHHGDGLYVDLGDWNFSTMQDAQNWASSRSNWNFDERSGIGDITFYRTWDPNDPTNFAGSEYWSANDWNPFHAWEHDLSYATVFENPGFPLAGSSNDGFARLAALDTWANQMMAAGAVASTGWGNIRYQDSNGNWHTIPGSGAAQSSGATFDFNYVKFGVSLVNAANAGRLAAAGLLKLGVGGASSVTGVGTAPGLGMMAWGFWNLSSSRATAERGWQQFYESFQESRADASLRNLWGVAPFGQNFDDRSEPTAREFFRHQWQDAKTDPSWGKVWRFIKELGSWGG